MSVSVRREGDTDGNGFLTEKGVGKRKMNNIFYDNKRL